MAAPTTLQPWLTFSDCKKAVEFYKAAFGAVETYRLETPEGVVVKLSVGGAEFWLSSGGETKTGENVGGGTVRFILIVENPQPLFDAAIKAGGTVVFPVGEGHGWLLGRIVDPFGLHWEIGHPL